MNKEGIACIAMDFDFTLARYRVPHSEWLLPGFSVIFNMNQETVERAFRKSVEVGFSPDTMVSCAKELADNPSVFTDEKLADVRSLCAGWMNSIFDAYSDSIPFLNNFWGKTPIAIITHGDQKFQREKIWKSRVPYDHLYVVNARSNSKMVLRRKVDAIHALLKQYGGRIIFIDDKPEELDSVRHRFEPDMVTTVRMMRPDGVYGKEWTRYGHPIISSLSDPDVSPVPDLISYGFRG